jgi:hypothetical protein
MEFYHVVQWLEVGAGASYVVRQILTIGQAHPQSPLELIARWQRYLNKSRDVCRRFGKHGWDKKNTDGDFEREWNRGPRWYINESRQGFDEEEFIPSLESFL